MEPTPVLTEELKRHLAESRAANEYRSQQVRRCLDDGKGDDDNDDDGNGDVDDDDDHRQELRQEEAKRHQGEQDEMGPIRIRWRFY